jgi:transketolase
VSRLSKVSKQLRKNILRASFEAQAGHIPSAFSILEIIHMLYKNVLQDNDVFVLSKGHGCLALYAVFLEMKFITEEQFYSFSQYDSLLGGHPHRGKHSKIYASTGSLGHGLPICIGAALAKKIGNKNDKVYCLVGDGECNEGTIWESAMLADKLRLDNLVCIIDNNVSQTRSMPTKDLSLKFNAFGWKVIEVYDGHDTRSLYDALTTKQDRPLCVICNTIKGRGIKEMENNMFAWHHGPPDKEQYSLFCEELDA